MSTVLIFLISFFVAFFSIPYLRKLAFRFNILDVPNYRKIHKEPIPLLGGLGVYLGVVAGLLFNFTSLRFFSGILIGGTIIFILGLVDDMRKLSARLRLVVQIISVVVIMLFGVRFSFLPSTWWGDMGEVILTMIWVIGITNALNYLDGIDGLAASVTALSAFFFSVILSQTAQPQVSLVSALLVAGCLGFLPHNLSKTKIFLGDAGSTFMGFMLASIAIQGNWAEDNIVKLTVPILILGVPIFDMVFTTIMRIKEKKISNVVQWLQYAGKDHFHHRLIDVGLFSRGVLFFICFVTISLGLSAIMVSNERAVIGVLAIIQAAIIFWMISVLMFAGKRLSSELTSPESQK